MSATFTEKKRACNVSFYRASRKTSNADNRQNQKAMKYKKQINEILASPVASYWLKDALKALDSRDPVDALNDAEALARIMETKLDELVAA